MFRFDKLSQRVSSAFIITTLVTSLMWLGATILFLYILEDGYFDHTLIRVSEEMPSPLEQPEGELSYFRDMYLYHNQDKIPFIGKKITIGEGQRLELSEADKHYHILGLAKSAELQPVLVYDVTKQLKVNHMIDEISIIALPIIVLLMLLSIHIAKRVAAFTLSPFDKLVHAIESNDIKQIESSIEGFKGGDLRLIAAKLVSSLQRQDALLTEKIAFNQGISHELRTPLQVMRQAIELLEMKMPDDASVGRVKRALRRMERTANCFLWLSKEESWGGSCNVDSVLQDVEYELKPMLDSRNKQLVIHSLPEQKLAMPEDVLGVVLINLLTNAVNYATNSLITLNVNMESIEISNQYQLETEQKGFGLGLDIAKKLCRRFDYKMKFAKNDTNFTVTINR